MQRPSHVFSPPVIAALSVGLLLTVAAVVVVRSQNDHRTREWMEDRGGVIAAATERTFHEVSVDLQAIAAFVELSDDVSLEDFRTFVDATEPEAGFIGIAYIEVVTSTERASYEARMGQSYPGFEMWELLASEATPAAEREYHLPVVSFASSMVLTATSDPGTSLSNDEPLGFDAASLSGAAFLVDAIDDPQTSVSDYIEISELALPGRAIVLHTPVRGSSGEVEGFVVAASLESILVPILATGPVSEEVTWTIGSPGSAPPSDLEWRTLVDLPNRTWELVVTPAEPALAYQQHLSVMAALAVGAAFTLLLVAAVALYRLRSQARLRAETLERLADERSRFIATVSHELRTPLTSVSGLVSELHDRWADFDQEEAVELLGLAKSEAIEMAGIVEDLLVAARLEAATLSFAPQVIDVAAEYRAAATGTGVSADEPDPGVTAYADPNRMRQIVRNLLTNAHRYGGDRIAVTAETLGGLAVLEVMDDGPPIPKDRRSTIFEPFTSAHQEGRALESIGLGLFISRKLALSMGGDLSYEHDGEWSRFQLVLPSRAPDHRPGTVASGAEAGVAAP